MPTSLGKDQKKMYTKIQLKQNFLGGYCGWGGGVNMDDLHL